jgi:hypothetical protein
MGLGCKGDTSFIVGAEDLLRFKNGGAISLIVQHSIDQVANVLCSCAPEGSALTKTTLHYSGARPRLVTAVWIH